MQNRKHLHLRLSLLFSLILHNDYAGHTLGGTPKQAGATF